MQKYQFFLFYIRIFCFFGHVQSLDQSGGVSLTNIWQQNANTMNQMLGGFSPCKMEFSGPSSQMSYGNQFGNFKPGTVGKRSVEKTENCPCPGVDSKGCPTCVCSTSGDGQVEGLVQPSTTSGTVLPLAEFKLTNQTRSFKNFTTTTFQSTKETYQEMSTVSTTFSEKSNVNSFIIATMPNKKLQGKQDDLTQENKLNDNQNFQDHSEQTKNSTGSTRVVHLPLDDTTVYIGIVTGLATVLCFVTITSFVFLYKWRKATENLKHEQNELYFTEKSFRISMERQHGKNQDDEHEQERSVSMSSNYPTPPASDISLDSVFTVDQTTDVKSPINSPSYGEQLSAPLMSPGSNVFLYPPEAYRHEYLELM
ncbi:uncharacterized protein LOC127721290 [Mytilus californianus]|uniref:uncharacterized protein LOC127721290 n=1 Tax=Mytilus californianus TaxID=6549 RepID=UPI0022468D12|nr:uncharacterized protein LOC127721290 [Mytilus californianus]